MTKKINDNKDKSEALTLEEFLKAIGATEIVKNEGKIQSAIIHGDSRIQVDEFISQVEEVAKKENLKLQITFTLHYEAKKFWQKIKFN